MCVRAARQAGARAADREHRATTVGTIQRRRRFAGAAGRAARSVWWGVEGPTRRKMSCGGGGGGGAVAAQVRVLARRTKNNPCLIGEPGVGKTSITEGAREHGPALQAVVMGMYR